MNTISYNEFLDKIHGCWYGKCLGGAAGAPVEGIKKVIEVDDFSTIYNPDIPNDDLDLQLLWLDVLEEKGAIISPEDLAEAWIKKCPYAMSEYGYFMKNYERGIKPPYTGVINNSFFCEGMGCVIRSEIWGVISAGNPKLAAQYAYMDATLDHSDNAVYAEQMMAIMESIAFFESDAKKIITEACKYIPENSRLNHCIRLVLDEYDKHTNYLDTRTKVINKFGHPDFTNIIQNFGFILIAFLYGECDMRKTINIALKCGYDADCTCASVASIVGIINGYSRLNDVSGYIKDYFIWGVNIERPSNSIKQLAEDTLKVALSVPNYEIEVTDVPENLRNAILKRPSDFNGFELKKVDKNGLAEEYKKINPTVWDISLPFYEQLDTPVDPSMPSPHAPGSKLPDIVCMVNNKVMLDKEYIDERKLDIGELSCKIESFEDWIDVDGNLTIQGQMCCYAQTELEISEDRKLWVLIGNSDGFVVWIDDKEIIRRDEMRYWTPYNNYALVDLKKGKHKVTVKLLRRTDNLKFTIGYKIFTEGNHWHGSRWFVQ